MEMKTETRVKGTVCFQKLMMWKNVTKPPECNYKAWEHSSPQSSVDVSILDILLSKLKESISVMEGPQINH